MKYKKSSFLYFYKDPENGKNYILNTFNKKLYKLSDNLNNFLKSRSIFEKNEFIKSGFKNEFELLLENGFLINEKTNEINDLEKKYKNSFDPNHLVSLHIIPTLDCTLKCKYCFVLGGGSVLKPDDHEMSFETAKKGIKLFYENNTCDDPYVAFYGGEALIKADFMFKCIDFIEKELKKNIRKRIITNATLVTHDIAKKLKNYDFEVAVSIDGKEKAHNQNRIFHDGCGSFEKTIHGYNILKEAGCNPNILCTVGSHNLSDLEEHVLFLISLEPSAIALNLPRAIESGQYDLEKNITPRLVMEKFLKCLEILYENGIPELHFLKLLYYFYSNEKVYKPCPACGSRIAISPSSLIGPCQAFAPSRKFFIKMPKTKKEVLEDPIFKKWAEVNVFNSSKCRNCNIIPLCFDDCPLDRYNRNKSLVVPSPMQCFSRKVMIDILLNRLVTGKKIYFGGKEIKDSFVRSYY